MTEAESVDYCLESLALSIEASKAGIDNMRGYHDLTGMFFFTVSDPSDIAVLQEMAPNSNQELYLL